MMTRSQTACPSVTCVRAKLDLAALGKRVAQVSQLATRERRILSLDPNPVFVTESGAQVVDFKIEYSE
jgi:hypothetical protein